MRGGEIKTLEDLEAVALEIVHSTGGLSLHACEGGWCVHVGPHNAFLGCSQGSIAQAVTHAFVDHTDPISGAPIDVRRMTSVNHSQSNCEEIEP